MNMYSLVFWQTIQRHRVGSFVLLFALAILLGGATYVCILRFQVKSHADDAVEFSMFRENNQSNRVRNAAALGVLSLLCLVLSVLQFATILKLQSDLQHELPIANTTGTVRGEYKFFFFDSYINIDGVLYRYSSEVPNTWPEKGNEYEVTYLEHSKIITQLKEK
ncbi:hypothetical protein SDC9_49715 [bioreactor metagenome]|uniref:Uncharacterized protein n=1 Tax=bioreactor metagenome TaxID=1076179 RepID=A0A644WIY6_9ZZZZ